MIASISSYDIEHSFLVFLQAASYSNMSGTETFVSNFGLSMLLSNLYEAPLDDLIAATMTLVSITIFHFFILVLYIVPF